MRQQDEGRKEDVGTKWGRGRPTKIQVRQRLKDDYRYYAEKALRIRTKRGTIEPFRLNKEQGRFLEAIENQKKSEGKVRAIILKARQLGFSTFTEGYLYFSVSQSKASKALVVAHKSDSATSLFDMTRRFYDHTPDILKPHSKYSSRRELVFDRLDSSMVVATAGGEGIARGETITHLHASELAFWGRNTSREIWNGLIQAVPDAPGTVVIVESTANGVSGLFYDLWQGAVTGTNGYIPFFSPWFEDPAYRAEPRVDFVRTPDEEALVRKIQKTYGAVLDDSQLYWRRLKMAQNGQELFRQEYPAFPEEAFLSTGRPVFNPDQIMDMIHGAAAPIARRALEADAWVDHPLGELLVYAEPEPHSTYVIGADIGKGVRSTIIREPDGYVRSDTDWSVAEVLDDQKRVVAKWRAQVAPDYFALVLDRLGKLYNLAKIVPENNDHGILTCFLLQRDYAYPHLYTEVQHDKLTDKETVKLGFSTNVRTKPMVIDKLRGDMRSGELKIDDRDTLREMMAFVLTETGRMEADEGGHDDCVMALALANYGHMGLWKPIKNSDEFYEEAL